MRRSPERVTLRHIADAAGVHPATASRALNPRTAAMISDETRQRIQAVASRLGYIPSVPARTLRKGRSHTVGVIVADLENPYSGRMIRGVENALDGRGMMALVAETRDDVDRMARIVDHLLGRSIDAIICSGARKASERVLRKAFNQVPVVLVDRVLSGSGLPSVAPDDHQGGGLAARHLIDLGHTLLAQVKGSRDISSFERRARGFDDAVAASPAEQIELDETAAEPSVDEGSRIMSILIASSPVPTGVFAHNDHLALGVLRALDEHGLSCPGYVSVVGYDDLPVTEFTSPPLTSIHLPGYQLGRMAAELAVAMTEDPTYVTSDLVVSLTMTIRGSTAAPRSAPVPTAASSS